MQNITSTRTSSTAIQSVAGALGVLGGIWLIISPFLLGYDNLKENVTAGQNATTMGIICGVISILLAGFCLVTERMPEMRNIRIGASVGLILMGVWLMSAPYLFNYSEYRDPLINLQITGIIFVIVAGYVFQEVYYHYRENTNQ